MSKPLIIGFYKKNKLLLLRIFTNPLILALPIALIIVINLPAIFSKYRVEINQTSKLPSHWVYYDDLNGDGISEKILFYQMHNDFFSLTVFVNDKIVDQWNFTGIYMGTPKSIVCRLGKGGTKSIYFFVFRNNKIYLNCLSPLENKFITKDKFVIDYTPKNKELDYSSVPIIFYDSNKDGVKEFYFASSVSYSKTPRRIFKYDPAKDTVCVSCKSYAAIAASFTTDISNGNLSIISASLAIGNSKATDPYSDMYAWLMDFNDSLNFKYKPLIIGNYPSMSNIVPISAGNRKYFAVMNIYSGVENHFCSLRLIDLKMNIVKEKDFPFTPVWQIASLYSPGRNSNFFYIIKTDGQIEKVDFSLNEINQFKIPAIRTENFFSEDVDGDYQDELIFQSEDLKKIIIVRNDFSNYVEADCKGFGNYYTTSMKMDSGKPPQLILSSPYTQLAISYKFNNLYYLCYPFYALVYFAVFLLIFLIEKSQRRRAELKYESEKCIAELQMKSIKNQLDPHFTLNIINSIGSLFYKQDKDKADYIFGKYSRLLRLTVLNSDKIVTTLADELEYVENYLELEKFRSQDKFVWKVDIEKEINTNIKLPKTLVHTFIENSIKHGLRHLEQNGELLITVVKIPDAYIIKITDNGIGRKKAMSVEYGNTGRGLSILDQILDLYYSLMKTRIAYEIKDIIDDNGKALGTEVTINIPVNKTLLNSVEL